MVHSYTGKVTTVSIEGTTRYEKRFKEEKPYYPSCNVKNKSYNLYIDRCYPVRVAYGKQSSMSRA